MVFLILFTLLSTIPIAAQSSFSAAPSPPPDPAVLAPLLSVSDLTVQPLQFSSMPDSPELIVEVELGGQPVTLSLFPHSIRGDEFRVLTDDGTGNLTEVPAPPILTRRGTVLEIPDSEVYASFDGTGLSATITTPNRAFSIQPVADLVTGHDLFWHAVFDHQHMIATGHTCAFTGPGGSTGGVSGGGSMLLGGTTYSVVDVAIDVDFEYFQINGSSLSQTVNEVESVMNGVEAPYDDPGILIVIELTTIVIRTNFADPYGTETDVDILLNAFRNNWNSSPESAIQRDVAHLFSGVNFAGSTIGYATGPAICTSFSYGIDQMSFSANLASRRGLVAHELGHNWSAGHCNAQSECRIMCSGFGGCNGLQPLMFAPVPAGQIINYRNSRPCLSTRPPPNPIPFFDPFATTSISNSRWSYNRGGVVSSQGVGEPSGNLSIVLDSAGSGTWSDDELRSNYIELFGVSDAHLSFFTEHRGVDAGEELVVEYLNSSLHWVELDRFTSNGIDESSYTHQVYDLPAAARHDKFRVKFRTEGNSTSDDWFIDDVLVDNGPPIPPPVPSLVLVQPDSGTLAGGIQITVFGVDFQPSAIVTVGNLLLENLVFIDDTQIQGDVPLGLAAGSVDVIVSQDSGSDILDDGFTYTGETIRHGLAQGTPGSTVLVPVTAEHESALTGFSLAIDFEPSLIEIVEVTDICTDIDGADFFQPSYDNSPGAGGGWWTLGVVLSFSSGTTLAPSTNSLLALATYEINAALPLGIDIALTPVSGIGAPSTENLLVGLQGLVLVPVLEPGQVTTSGVLFVRGDTNGDSSLNIADAISVLGYLFSSDPATCLDAYDGNDDGSVNIADAISLLDFIFSQGSPPPAPFPSPGIDPTADPLDCA